MTTEFEKRAEEIETKAGNIVSAWASQLFPAGAASPEWCEFLDDLYERIVFGLRKAANLPEKPDSSKLFKEYIDNIQGHGPREDKRRSAREIAEETRQRWQCSPLTMVGEIEKTIEQDRKECPCQQKK